MSVITKQIDLRFTGEQNQQDFDQAIERYKSIYGLTTDHAIISMVLESDRYQQERNESLSNNEMLAHRYSQLSKNYYNLLDQIKDLQAQLFLISNPE